MQFLKDERLHDCLASLSGYFMSLHPCMRNPFLFAFWVNSDDRDVFSSIDVFSVNK